MDLFEELKVEVKEKHPSIVFPEGEDERVLKAAFRLKEENIFEIDNVKESIIRLVTNYRTSEEDVRGFLNSLKK